MLECKIADVRLALALFLPSSRFFHFPHCTADDCDFLSNSFLSLLCMHCHAKPRRFETVPCMNVCTTCVCGRHGILAFKMRPMAFFIRVVGAGSMNLSSCLEWSVRKLLQRLEVWAEDRVPPEKSLFYVDAMNAARVRRS